MQPSFEIVVAVVCLTAVVATGCAVTGGRFGNPLQLEAKGPEMRRQGEVSRLEKAATFHDAGRYYK